MCYGIHGELFALVAVVVIATVVAVAVAVAPWAPNHKTAIG